MFSPRLDSFASARNLARAHSNFVIRAPAGFGKSSWLRDYCVLAEAAPHDELDAPKVRTVVINAAGFGTTESVSVTESFRRMHARILAELGVTTAGPLAWDRRPGAMLFRQGLEAELHRMPEAHLLLAFDDLDGLRNSRNAVELFDTLRALGEDNWESPLDRLRIVVATATPLNELGNALSSLNHWDEVELAPYTHAELTNALQQKGMSGVDPADIESLQVVLGGHPKLLEIALSEAEASPSGLLAWAGHGEGSPGVLRWFEGTRRFLGELPARGEAMRRGLRGEAMDTEVARVLVRLGVVRRNAGQKDSDPWTVTPVGSLLRRWLQRQVG